MAYSIFITAHGGRGQGTSSGTYLVPPGVNVHCYTDDAVLLKGGMGMAIEDRLMMPALDIATVQACVTKSYAPYDMMPNYTAFGAPSSDAAFQMATGSYYVGQTKGEAPSWAIGAGQKMRLSDIIAGYRKLASGLTDVYWLCCRAAPQNANNSEDVDLDAFGMIEKPKDMGLKPSQVKAKGGAWR